jgi:hypothetical protein
VAKNSCEGFDEIMHSSLVYAAILSGSILLYIDQWNIPFCVARGE